VLTVESATVDTLGGSLTGTARVASDGRARALDGRVEARGVDLTRLPAAGVAGTLGLRAAFAGPVPSASAFATAMTGEGSSRSPTGASRAPGSGVLCWTRSSRS
jgi:hypothetical protein